MFKVYEYLAFDPEKLMHCCIRNTTNLNQYLHSDGQVFDTPEYWPTEVDAQAVLDKFYPKPEHVWEHGDVFESGNGNGNIMIYMKYEGSGKSPQAFCIHGPIGGPALSLDCLDGAKFLFNIKEKI